MSSAPDFDRDLKVLIQEFINNVDEMATANDVCPTCVLGLAASILLAASDFLPHYPEECLAERKLDSSAFCHKPGNA